MRELDGLSLARETILASSGEQSDRSAFGSRQLCRRGHFRRDEIGEGADVVAHRSILKRGHVGLAMLDADDAPGMTSRREERIHEETPDAAVAVRIGMDVNEEEMSENRPHPGQAVGREQVEQCVEKLRHRFVRRRDVLRAANEHRAIAIAGQHARRNQARLHGRAEQRAIPRLQIAVDDGDRVLAAEDTAQALGDALEANARTGTPGRGQAAVC